MKIRFLTHDRRRLAVALVVFLLGASAMQGFGQSKKPAPAPAKPAAAPARPAAAAGARPATAGAGAVTASHTPAANATTTANRTTTTTANHPTTANSTGANHPTTANAGVGHPATTGSSGANHGAATAHGGAPAPRGSATHTTADGKQVTTRANGRVSDVHDPRTGMDVHNGLDGSRRVSVQRPDGSRLVAERGRPGYVQRGYSYHGHEFAARSYYYHGTMYRGYYRGYYYGGVYVNVYAPAYYYGPGFYGWAYNPWAAPVAYGWGWGATPWYGYYGAYFTPYPVYPSAAFWLTDYLIAANLQAAYASQAAAGAAAAGEAIYPATLNLSEQGGFGTFTWDGAHYSGTFSNGAVAVLSVAKWDANSVILSRSDPAGVSAGNQATYVGRIVTPTSIAGTVTGVYNGSSWTETFNANSPTSVLVTANPAQQPTVASAGATPLSPDVKQAIADEVKNEIALENAEATQTAHNQDVDPGSSGISRVIADVGAGHPHIFVVGSGLDVTNPSTGQECHVSDGDALQMQVAPAADAAAANVVVKASKGGIECAPGSTVAVNVADLQEMQNAMRQNIDAGLKELQTKQGQGGLPAAPPSAQTPPTQPQYAAIAPPPAPSDAADIQAQTSQGDAAVAAAAPSTPTAQLTPPR